MLCPPGSVHTVKSNCLKAVGFGFCFLPLPVPSIPLYPVGKEARAGAAARVPLMFLPLLVMDPARPSGTGGSGVPPAAPTSGRGVGRAGTTGAAAARRGGQSGVGAAGSAGSRRGCGGLQVPLPTFPLGSQLRLPLGVKQNNRFSRIGLRFDFFFGVPCQVLPVGGTAAPGVSALPGGPRAPPGCQTVGVYSSCFHWHCCVGFSFQSS